MESPLFPLNTVLFPGGKLELRIFECRYLDMIRDCMRANTGFGLCMKTAGDETQLPWPMTVGTEARIVDFCTLPDGLLGITVQGFRRFHVDKTHRLESGLIHGELNYWEEESPIPVPPEHALLAIILSRLADQDDELGRANKSCFDNASWVGFRLAERLPISLAERQQVLQMQQPIERLDQLAQWLSRFQKD